MSNSDAIECLHGNDAATCPRCDQMASEHITVSTRRDGSLAARGRGLYLVGANGRELCGKLRQYGLADRVTT